MLVTCGLRNVGPSVKEGGEAFGLHGEVSYSPAMNVSTNTHWARDRYFIEIYGEVRESYPFGPNLCMKRTWRTELGADWIELEDTVSNEGFQPEMHMQLYHWNFGYPLVNEKTSLTLSTDTTVPRDEAANQGLSRWSLFDPPSQNAQEQVFHHSYSTVPPEETTVRIVSNAEAPRWIAEVTYSSLQLPELTQWKCCRQGEYVLGIEPGNCRPEGREMHRSHNAPLLYPGESAHFKIRMRVLSEAL
jgi:hypothetical protein